MVEVIAGLVGVAAGRLRRRDHLQQLPQEGQVAVVHRMLHGPVVQFPGRQLVELVHVHRDTSAAQIWTIILPRFSPRSIARKASGAFSRPSTTVSSNEILPSASQGPTSASMAGSRSL